MLTIEQYADKHKIEKNKVKQMCPYIDSAEQCVCCKKWLIPEDAAPVYIPDKRLYSKTAKKYCYVLDAINNNQLIIEKITNISEEECRQLVKELAEHKLIKPIAKDTYDYRNYMLSIKGTEWRQKNSKEKTKIVMEVLKIVLSAAEVALKLGETRN